MLMALKNDRARGCTKELTNEIELYDGFVTTGAAVKNSCCALKENVPGCYAKVKKTIGTARLIFFVPEGFYRGTFKAY